MTGTLGGRYQLTGLLASGEHGEVWQALDRGTGRFVAVKVLYPLLAEDFQLVDRLLRARAGLTGLWHAGIARVLDVVADGDAVALVMDLVPGKDLRRVLDQSGPLPPERAAEIGAAMADALGAAHRQGIVHGDMKPSNVLVPPPEAGSVRLTDFSLTVLIRAGWRNREPAGASPYTAPEVTEGAVPTSPSDIYAVGVILYEMLSGTATVPMEPTSVAQARLLEIVDRCVLEDPAARPTAASLSDQLRALIPYLSAPQRVPRRVTARPARPPRAPAPRRTGGNGRIALVVAAVIIVVVGVVVGTKLLSPAGRARPGGSNGSTAAQPATGPALPAAAATRTKEGGEQFIRHWFAMFGYAEQTGDTAGLSAITNPSCADCKAAIATIRAAYADGGSLRGGEYVVHTVVTSALWTLDRPLYEVALDRSARSTVDRAGISRPNLPALAFASCLLVLEWTGGRWRLLEVTSHGCVA